MRAELSFKSWFVEKVRATPSEPYAPQYSHMGSFHLVLQMCVHCTEQVAPI